MSGSRRAVLGFFLAACFCLTTATAASAATFYVNQLNGEDKNPCSKAAPCATLEHAIAKAETVTGPNTIEVENKGTYAGVKDKISLIKSSDEGLTINGEHGVTITGSGAMVTVGPAAGTVKVTGIKFIDTAGAEAPISVGRGSLVLEGDELSDPAGSASGIEVIEGSSLTMKGGTIEMEGSTGFDVTGLEGSAVTLEGVRILNGLASGDEAGGVKTVGSTLSMSNSTIALESGSPGKQPAVQAKEDPSVSLQNDLVKQSNLNAPGVIVETSPLAVNGLEIEMSNSSSKQLAFGFANTAGASTLSHLQVGGRWLGVGAVVRASQPTTVDDSSIATNPLSTSPAMLFTGSKAGSGLLLQRSVVSSPKTAEASLFIEAANGTLDSSEVLGGLDAVKFEQKVAGASALTVSASTIDANVPGTAEDAPGVNGVYAQATTEPGASTNVAIQGSIVLEKQTSVVEPGDTGSVACSYSAVPSQAQAAGSGSGGIACASGTNGNTEVNPLSALFAEPLGSYQLSPSSTAVDSVPAGAVALPFGFAPSTTDLAGNPRVVDGNGDCIAVQDKGALELQGHSAPCPVAKTSGPPAGKPAAPSITGLSISPSAFRAAPKGATLAKVKYGAKLAWRDSQPASAGFTVVRLVPGRRQGRSCKKPSRRNRHGRRCTLHVTVGAFTHADRAGANSGRFSGRIHGHKLTPGNYLLLLAPRNAAGIGATVSKAFRII